jgi:YtcA family
MELTSAPTSLALWATVWFSGCDPVVSVAGADFPDWLICVMLGSLLSAACHPLLRRIGLERHLRPLPFFYGSLIVMFSLVTWVALFNRV